MRFVTQRLKRLNMLAVAISLLAATVLPVLNPPKAGAYGLLTSREVKLSTSAGAATDATYDVSVTIPTTGNIGGLVVDFCSNSPIIGDTCTAPTGFDINEAGSPGTPANQSGVTDWAEDATTDTNTLVLTRTAASVSASTVVSFDIGSSGGSDGPTNPTASNTTFYARVLTYTTTAGAQAYTSTAPGAEPPLAHAGGVALSTADQITIQAKVQERLTFCVYTSAVNTTDCSVTTTNPVTLGDANGVLSATAPSISKDAKYNISTNASSGAIIRAKSSAATLTSGSNTIEAANAGAATGEVYDDDSEQFGLCNYRHTGGGATGLTAASNYDGDLAGATETACAGTTDGQTAGFDNGAAFTFDTTTGGDNLTTTYGDTIASKTAGNLSTGVLVFLGSISNTTEPGIYTTTMTFVATGTY